MPDVYFLKLWQITCEPQQTKVEHARDKTFRRHLWPYLSFEESDNGEKRYVVDGGSSYVDTISLTMDRMKRECEKQIRKDCLRYLARSLYLCGQQPVRNCRIALLSFFFHAWPLQGRRHHTVRPGSLVYSLWGLTLQIDATWKQSGRAFASHESEVVADCAGGAWRFGGGRGAERKSGQVRLVKGDAQDLSTVRDIDAQGRRSFTASGWGVRVFCILEVCVGYGFPENPKFRVRGVSGVA